MHRNHTLQKSHCSHLTPPDCVCGPAWVCISALLQPAPRHWSCNEHAVDLAPLQGALRRPVGRR